MKTSAAWLLDRNVYTFQQVMNPGPTTLLPSQDITLNETKSKVAKFLRLQEKMTRIINTRDEPARAEKLKPYVLSTDYQIRQIAIGELVKCGPAGAKAIRDMLNTPAFAGRVPELTEALNNLRYTTSSR
jgi:hypothetical protein